MRTSARLVCALSLGAPLPACFLFGGDGDTTATASATNTTNTTNATNGTLTDGQTSGVTETGGGVSAEAVDILFVLDDTGSMAPAQERLSASLTELLDPLVTAGVSYRIAVTTTDNGNPRCPKANTTPPQGDLLLASCLERLDDFIFDGTDPPTDGSYACLDHCVVGEVATVATTTDLDPTSKPRPWIEAAGDKTNLAGGVAPIDALRCVLPQGTSGCGFESPLESMARAIARFTTPGEAAYGFLRPDAHFVVIIVSDETDCSYTDANKEVFIDNKVFWNSPDDPIPTSGVCWRAGVTCSGDGPKYTECHADNHSSSGSAGASDIDAVLHPLSRYQGIMEQIAADKAASGISGNTARLYLIDGVPEGYAAGADLEFNENDPSFVVDHGIGPGCTSATIAAVPPVRERELAEALSPGQRPAYSICSADYGDALGAIGQSIVAAL